ncbi:MAG: nitrous oxide reductase accessory protein NosL [Fluviicola sp.]|nr:nitrous oxide reductase accessory protein NosL [Fluviicola sp.]
MKIIKILTSLFLVVVMQSCSVEPQVINFGKVHCHHCDMTVVDKSHAAEYVTKKGKAYFFDAAECLVMKINDEDNENDLAFILVSDFTNPGNLIDAIKANFVVSEAIKSPMGANLSSFSSTEDAQKIIDDNDGEMFTWNEIKSKLKE